MWVANWFDSAMRDMIGGIGNAWYTLWISNAIFWLKAANEKCKYLMVHDSLKSQIVFSKKFAINMAFDSVYDKPRKDRYSVIRLASVLSTFRALLHISNVAIISPVMIHWILHFSMIFINLRPNLLHLIPASNFLIHSFYRSAYLYHKFNTNNTSFQLNKLKI